MADPKTPAFALSFAAVAVAISFMLIIMPHTNAEYDINISGLPDISGVRLYEPAEDEPPMTCFVRLTASVSGSGRYKYPEQDTFTYTYELEPTMVELKKYMSTAAGYSFYAGYYSYNLLKAPKLDDPESKKFPIKLAYSWTHSGGEYSECSKYSPGCYESWCCEEWVRKKCPTPVSVTESIDPGLETLLQLSFEHGGVVAEHSLLAVEFVWDSSGTLRERQRELEAKLEEESKSKDPKISGCTTEADVASYGLGLAKVHFDPFMRWLSEATLEKVGPEKMSASGLIAGGTVFDAGGGTWDHVFTKEELNKYFGRGYGFGDGYESAEIHLNVTCPRYVIVTVTADGIPPACKAEGLACASDGECCSGYCDGICKVWPPAEFVGFEKMVTIEDKDIAIIIDEAEVYFGVFTTKDEEVFLDEIIVGRHEVYINDKRYKKTPEYETKFVDVGGLPEGGELVGGVGITFGANVAIFISNQTALVVNRCLLGLSCKLSGESCSDSWECHSGRCLSRTCTSAIVATVDGLSTVSPATSASGFGRAGTKSTTVRETERKVMAEFIADVFGWARKKTETTSTCVRGAACLTSADCCGAGCADGYCLCSTRVCSSSGECCSGYCDEGLCTPPPSMLLFALSRPFNGCAGLVEECLPGEGSCFLICNALTLFLLAASAVSGVAAWRRFGHPAGAIAGAFVPLATGLAAYPFAGIIAALLLIAMLSYVRMEAGGAPSAALARKEKYKKE